MIDISSQSKLLGIVWDSNINTFTISPSKLVEQASKLPASGRSLVRVTASIFDPINILSPFVIRLKMLFQFMCCEGLFWDQPLEGECLKQWNALIGEMKTLNEVKIPRCYFKKQYTRSLANSMDLAMHQKMLMLQF